MRRVLKWQLAYTDKPQKIGAGKVVLVDEQASIICVWTEETTTLPQNRWVYIVGTGHPVPDESLVHIGSVIMIDGEFVWHLYATPSEWAEPNG